MKKPQGRFPELAAVIADRSAGRDAVERIDALLRRELSAQSPSLDGSRFTATQFLQMVIAWPQRQALGMGVPMTETELDAWARQTVSLFLDGYRGWIEPPLRALPISWTK